MKNQLLKEAVLSMSFAAPFCFSFCFLFVLFVLFVSAVVPVSCRCGGVVVLLWCRCGALVVRRVFFFLFCSILW